MRYFLKTVYERKRGKKALESAIEDVRSILESKNLKEERQLFHLKGVNESKKESYAPWNKMIKKYPHLEKYVYPYTTNGEEHNSFRITSNLPYFANGTLTFCNDPFDLKELEDIVCKYASYSGVLILDNIDYFGNCDFTPYCDGSAILEDTENYRLDDRTSGGARVDFVDNPFPQYVSNSVRFSSEFSISHEITVFMEIRNKEEQEKADVLLEIFEEKFGKPRKKYMSNGFSYDDLEEYIDKYKTSQEFLNQWVEDIHLKISELVVDESKKKMPSIATQKKNFLKKYGFERFPIKPWDDWGHTRSTEQNFYEYISFNEKMDGFGIYILGANFSRSFGISAIISNDIMIDDEKLNAYIYCQRMGFALDQFRAEVLPKFEEIYGASHELFVLNSAPAHLGGYERFGETTYVVGF